MPQSRPAEPSATADRVPFPERDNGTKAGLIEDIAIWLWIDASGPRGPSGLTEGSGMP